MTGASPSAGWATARAGSIAGRAAELGLAALVVGAPLLVGGVPRRAAALAGVVAFGVALAALAERALHGCADGARQALWPMARGHRRLLILGTASLAVATLGLVPLPSGVLAAVSPSTARLLDQVSGAAAPGGAVSAVSPAAWRPLSLAPADSIAALLRLAAVLAVAATVASTGSLGERRLGARAPRTAVRALALVASSATLVAALALLQQATWNGRIGWMFTPADWAGRPPDSMRASGPFVNPDHFAAFAWLGVVAGAALVTQARFATNSFTRRMRDALSLGGAAAVVACGVGVVASGSRTAAAAALGAGAAWAWWAARWRAARRAPRAAPGEDGRRVRARRVAIVGLALASVALVTWSTSRNARSLADRWVTAVRSGSASDAWSARTAVWSGTAAMIEAFPAGVGLGVWPTLHPLFSKPPAHAWSWRHAHSEPLELLAEVGLVGALVFAVSLVAAVCAVLQRRRDEPPHELAELTRQVLVIGLAGTALQACLDFPLRAPACALALAVLVGAGLRRRGDPAPSRVGAGPAVPGARRGALLARSAVAVLASFVAAVGLAGSLADVSSRFAGLRLGPVSASDELEVARASLAAAGGPAALSAERAASLAASFRRAVAASPARAEAHHAVAVTTPEPVEAAHELALAATLAPWSALYQDQLAMLALAHGDDERARAHVTRALRADPDLERHPYLAHGAGAGIGAALADAVEAGLTRAFGEDPDPRLAGSNLARFHEQRGAPAAQGRTLLALSEIDPGERRWLVGAVGAFRRAGDAVHAASAEERLLASAGDDRVGAEIALALEVYVPLGELERAAAIVDAAERRDGPRGALDVARGRIALARRDSAGAVAAFERAVDRMPASAEAALLLASALRAERRSGESLAAYRRALDLGADTPTAWAAIGELHELRREYHRAAEAYRVVLGKLPNDRRIHDALARVERVARGASDAGSAS